jgi:ABC-2 type transport system permease protein
MGLVIIFAFTSELFLSFLIGLVAFWADEVDGLYTTVTRLKKFLAGGYFPLSLLPPFYMKLSLSLPFAYSFFVPTQLYLGKMSLVAGLRGLGVQIAWILLLYGIIRLIWKRGIRKYEGVGI